MCQARQSEDLTEMRGVLSSQMQPRKAAAVLGEIVRTFGGYCAERLEAGGLPGLTFVLHVREGLQEEVVSHGRKGHVVILKWLVSGPTISHVPPT